MGLLRQLFTNLPWFRLTNERIPKSLIETHPFPALAYYGAKRFHIALPMGLEHRLVWALDESQQRFIVRRLKECDVFIALSGAGLFGGRLTQRRGGRFVCERASTHIVWQREVLTEEYRRFSLPPPFFDQRLVEKELQEYEESDVIVVPSRFVWRSFVDRGADPNKLVVNPYGVDLGTFNKDPVQRNDDEFRVVWVGQVSLRKGIPYLLKAFRRLRHPRKRLFIAGAIHSDMCLALRTLPQERVEFLGSMKKTQVRSLLNRCDAFCIASIEEGMAYATVEAMACGLPVVATHNSGAGEILQEGREGFLVPAQDDRVIADRLQQLADDPGLRLRMGELGRQRVHEIGGWREYGDRYIGLISRLTGRARLMACQTRVM
jgi:alpha-maltose-1-phosphate synthase